MKTIQQLFDLSGKVAIVTGGRGLYGASISEALCEAGATVAICSRNGEKCEEYAAKLREKGFRAFGLSLDLSDDASIEALVGAVAEREGHIDILINNAVDRANLTDLDDATREKLQASLNTNLTGTMMLSQAVIPYMKAQGGGSIVNITSMRGLDCPHFPFYPGKMQKQTVNYTTEKWAQEGLTKYMAGCYGKYNIRTNSIAPGGYSPAICETEDGKTFSENYIANCPLHRWANEDDIKGPVVFLASEAANYCNGATLVMDGGWTIW